MAAAGVLDKQWEQLMSLCRKETELREVGNHPRVLKLVASEIDNLARAMGFNERLIATREFRAERDGKRIVRVVTE